MTPFLMLSLVGVFAAVALAVGTVTWYVLAQNTPERRRLEQAGQAVGTQGLFIGVPLLSETPSDFVNRLQPIMPKSPKDMTRMRQRLVRAGYDTMTAVAVFSLAQLVTPVVFGALPFLFGPFSQIWPFVGIAAILGYLLPGFVVDYKTGQRQKVIRNGLPDALDLLIVCLESGSGMDQAIVKVSDELEIAYPALADELRMVITETRAGKPRLEAFRNFSARTGVDDVRALVAMLVQTDRFGTSVSQALRTHAEVSRTKRRQRAEERAAKIGVKLVFPLVFLLFPAFFTVTLGPAIVRFIRVFFGQIMGQ